mmetsp:Transcript_8207/g.18394  ORF Transcript_8207/g.18394 Transcript_8207/m.18394 type:complete len:86 (+) Transcript_8207:3637-3894(+)
MELLREARAFMKISRATGNPSPTIAAVSDSSNSVDTSSNSTAVDGDFPEVAAEITTASDLIIPMLGTTILRQDCKMGNSTFEFVD